MPRRGPSPTRIVLFLLIGLLSSACVERVEWISPTTTIDPGLQSELARLDAVAMRISETASGGEVAFMMAWEDLRRDVRSVLVDLHRNRNVDVVGLRGRVKSFRTNFETAPGVDFPDVLWDEYVDVLEVSTARWARAAAAEEVRS